MQISLLHHNNGILDAHECRGQLFGLSRRDLKLLPPVIQCNLIFMQDGTLTCPNPHTVPYLRPGWDTGIALIPTLILYLIFMQARGEGGVGQPLCARVYNCIPSSHANKNTGLCG